MAAKPAEATLEFDARSHVYMLDGEIVPSVTQLIKLAGLIDDRWFTPEATERGSRVHTICELDDVGLLNTEKVQPAFMPYLAAWRSFRESGRFTIQSIEERVSTKALGLAYAGTLDRRGLWDTEPAIVDIKTGDDAPWHGLQLAGYALTFDGGMRFRRVTVLLRGTGTFKVIDHRDRADVGAWMNLVALEAWKRRTGAALWQRQ